MTREDGGVDTNRKGRPFIDYWPTDAEFEAMSRAIGAAGRALGAAVASMAPAVAEAGRCLSRIQIKGAANDPVFALTQRPEWRTTIEARRSRGTGPELPGLDGRRR